MGFKAKAEQKREGFEKLTRPHLDALYRFTLQKVRNPQHAEDLVQDACLKAYRAFERFEAGTDYRSWIFTILRNTIVDFQRRNSREAAKVSFDTDECYYRHDDQAQSRHLLDPESQLMAGSLAAQLQSAVDELPPEWREVLLLSFVEGFSYQQIAHVVGCPIGTVMSRLYRARKFLREKLAGHIDRAAHLDFEGSSIGDTRSQPIDLIRHRAKVWSKK